PRWDEVVAMEWPTLPLPELAVVLEAVGRAGIGGPLLPTALAAAVVGRLSGDDRRPELVARVEAGATAAVAFASAPLDDGPGGVRGTCEGVLGAAGAELLVLPA